MLPIFLALAFILLLFIIVLAGQPDEFKVCRSAKISAQPEAVFPNINELKKWDAWSPWAKLDPNCKITYAGPPAGVDASYSWSGNKKVGEGKLTIVESAPSYLVRLRLEFQKPFQATNTAEFTFHPEGGQTVVTWIMLGNNNFMSKMFGLFMSCDNMVGRDFEKGLAAMKAVVETSARDK